MKSKEELNKLKEEVEKLNTKLKELSDDELLSVTGGRVIKQCLNYSEEACSVCTNRRCKYSPVYVGN